MIQMGDLAEWLKRHSPMLCRVSAYSTSILVGAPFIYHIGNGTQAYLGFFEDDYFYYAIIADKLTTLGKLTYDGTTLTNGFHPLWFLVIAMLRAVSGRFGAAFYVALAVVIVTSMIVTYELGRRFARELGASQWLSASVAVTYSFGTAQLFSTGMECVVAVPLFLWLLLEVAKTEPITSSRAARIGFIASLAILGRLDLAIGVALLIVGFIVLVRPPLAEFGRLLGAFCLGGMLLPLYFAANFIWFGSPLPMSALAKQLHTGFGFNFTYAQRVARGTVYGQTVGVVLPLGVLALLLLVRTNPMFRPTARFAGAVALVFAFVFFGLNALSGWVFFGWYAFPISVAATPALVFICQRWVSSRRAAPFLAMAAALLVALAPVRSAIYYLEHGPRWSVADNSLLAMSYELSDSVRGLEGLFAMGAIAGFATYVLDKPVLQLEGLVADRQMVEHLRHQDQLEDVLREYKADYLIVSLASAQALRSDDGCYLVTQPNAEWAGTRTKKMRGEICEEPVVHLFTKSGSNSWSRFPPLETFVWDLRKARWRDER